MPVMDGYTATREIRRQAAFKDMPIIAMTANAMSGDREKVLESGMNDHIAKPLNVGEMFNTIARWVGTGAQPAACSAEPPAVVTAPPPVEGLGNLPGIDIGAGLATTMGNEKLFRKLLGKFREGQKDFRRMFKAACVDPDKSASARVAHTLKGTAGNIGAKGVQQAAEQLEHACLNGLPDGAIDDLLAAVETTLSPVIEGIGRVIGTAANTQGAPKENAQVTPEIEAQLMQLKALLADSDSAAGLLLDRIIDEVNGTSLAAKLREVVTAVANYDFDEALAALEQAYVKDRPGNNPS